MVILNHAPPTVQLPPIARLKLVVPADLLKALAYLRLLYNPEIQVSRKLHRRGRGPNGAASGGLQDLTSTFEPASLDTIRTDSFERAWSIRWLTSLVSQAGRLTMESDDSDWEAVLQEAAWLLAICAGAASAGTRPRVFSFSPPPQYAASDIKVQLIDLPLDNQDYTSVGAQTWGGACLLADMIVQSPSKFGLAPTARPLRLLELGAGTGLVGLAVAKLLQSNSEDLPTAEVVTTDYQPSILANLRANVATNFSSDNSLISTHFLDWSDYHSSSAVAPEPPFDTPFDVIYGADIVYELEHARWIKSCVETLLRKPTRDNHVSLSTPLSPSIPRFHLVIPLRSTHAAESQAVEDVFSFASDADTRAATDSPVLAIVGRERVVCEDLARNSGGEVNYVHYTMAWV